MKIFQIAKDGGKDSNSTGLFFVEIKSLFTVVLLRFSEGTREAYHSHAFNAWTIWLRGRATEYLAGQGIGDREWRAGEVKYTPRNCVHKVAGGKRAAYALSFRGPWANKWIELREKATRLVTLTHGRKELEDRPFANTYGLEAPGEWEYKG